MDPRLEVIVERMLDKYDSSILLVICFLINEVLISIYHKCFFSGVFSMANTNRLWVWLLSADDLINWRKQSLDVTIFM
jgi:hypothetical protein